MPLPVITVEQMREWEKATWATGQTEIEVIRRVGKRVAQTALALTLPQDEILILAGKGNNGADARGAREHLQDRRVNLLDVSDPEVDLSKLQTLLSLRPALIIDGLFGIGLNRPLSEAWVRFIETINQARLNVLAVDVPSGFDAASAKSQGAAINSAVTLTVGTPKQGLLKEPAWQYVGRLEVATDVGLVASPPASNLLWTVPQDFRGFPPRRGSATHKGTYGHLAIVAGSLGFHGAAVLAARGAQRAQPGLITLFTGEPIYHVVASQLQAVMVSPWAEESKLPGNWSAILLGPGLAAPSAPDQVKILVRHLWRDASGAVIVDASALDWLPLDLAPRAGPRVITPHPGEAARLLRSTTQAVQSDRSGAVRELSKLLGNAWVVLKGHQTLIGRAQGDIHVNSSGNPHLAQGASGDLLSGYIAGWLAQRHLDVGYALSYAVWQHAATADLLQTRSPNCWTIEDLALELGKTAAG